MLRKYLNTGEVFCYTIDFWCLNPFKINKIKQFLFGVDLIEFYKRRDWRHIAIISGKVIYIDGAMVDKKHVKRELKQYKNVLFNSTNFKEIYEN